MFQKKFFFLSGQALTPPPLVAGQPKKTFFCCFPKQSRINILQPISGQGPGKQSILTNQQAFLISKFVTCLWFRLSQALPDNSAANSAAFTNVLSQLISQLNCSFSISLRSIVMFNSAKCTSYCIYVQEVMSNYL